MRRFVVSLKVSLPPSLPFILLLPLARLDEAPPCEHDASSSALGCFRLRGAERRLARSPGGPISIDPDLRMDIAYRLCKVCTLGRLTGEVLVRVVECACVCICVSLECAGGRPVRHKSGRLQVLAATSTQRSCEVRMCFIVEICYVYPYMQTTAPLAVATLYIQVMSSLLSVAGEGHERLMRRSGQKPLRTRTTYRGHVSVRKVWSSQLHPPFSCQGCVYMYTCSLSAEGDGNAAICT